MGPYWWIWTHIDLMNATHEPRGLADLGTQAQGPGPGDAGPGGTQARGPGPRDPGSGTRAGPGGRSPRTHSRIAYALRLIKIWRWVSNIYQFPCRGRKKLRTKKTLDPVGPNGSIWTHVGPYGTHMGPMGVLGSI